jgi:UDP-GlcNAc:undecaprenyl-phosphate GlcNAc-1-phosphate transferase
MSWILPAVAGALTTVAVMLALRPVASASGLVDRPGGRKSHRGDVPVVGGIAMFFGMTVGLAFVPRALDQYYFMLFAAGILVAIGVLDDRKHVSLIIRFGAQAVASIVMVRAGDLLITDIGDPLGIGIIHMGPWAYPFSVLVCMSVINAFNFIDGIDGLAGSLALVAIGAVIVAAVGLSSVIVAGIVAAACVIAFLAFNFPANVNRRYRSFMGDAGSTLLGIVVLWLTISVTQGEQRSITPVVGLWFAIVPLADLFTCFTRRILKGSSPFRASRDHLHHILLRGHLSSRHVLLLLTGMGALYAIAGLLMHRAGVPDFPMFIGWSALMSMQYPLTKSIALSARSKCWRRVRERAAIARAASLSRASETQGQQGPEPLANRSVTST